MNFGCRWTAARMRCWTGFWRSRGARVPNTTSRLGRTAVKILKPEDLATLIPSFRHGNEQAAAVIAIAHTADAYAHTLLATAASAVLPPIAATAELAVLSRNAQLSRR